MHRIEIMLEGWYLLKYLSFLVSLGSLLVHLKPSDLHRQ